MKAKRLIYGLLAFVLVAGFTLETTAQDAGINEGAFSGGNRAGTAGASFLLVPTTARSASLGTTMTGGMAGLNGVEALYANPAGLAHNQGTSALFSRMEYVADIGINHFGIAQQFGNNNVALTISAWDFGDIPVQTELAPEADPTITYSASNIAAGLSFARQFTDRISAGITTKFVSESIDNVSSGGLAFDAGMSYTVGETGLSFGVALKNFGVDRSFSGTGLTRFRSLDDDPTSPVRGVAIEGADYELPSLLNFGVTYSRDVAEGAVVTVLGNFRSNSFTEDQYAGALEVNIRDLLYIRGGYQFQQDMDQSFYTGVNFGGGINLPLGNGTLTVDYANRAVDFFDNVQLITASITVN